ncbi:MAG: hypothetical protein CME68_02635 [Halobacteriovoraceae bacterium]|nr:hypothetical protein [Halobacteriovoraceae bacterium]|tara:strand:- start:155 stop:1201 length:1047 start_codon:yes stop_codon:yes gene_type:complete
MSFDWYDGGKKEKKNNSGKNPKKVKGVGKQDIQEGLNDLIEKVAPYNFSSLFVKEDKHHRIIYYYSKYKELYLKEFSLRIGMAISYKKEDYSSKKNLPILIFPIIIFDEVFIEENNFIIEMDTGLNRLNRKKLNLQFLHFDQGRNNEEESYNYLEDCLKDVFYQVKSTKNLLSNLQKTKITTEQNAYQLLKSLVRCRFSDSFIGTQKKAYFKLMVDDISTIIHNYLLPHNDTIPFDMHPSNNSYLEIFFRVTWIFKRMEIPWYYVRVPTSYSSSFRDEDLDKFYKKALEELGTDLEKFRSYDKTTSINDKYIFKSSTRGGVTSITKGLLLQREIFKIVTQFCLFEVNI